MLLDGNVRFFLLSAVFMTLEKGRGAGGGGGGDRESKAQDCAKLRPKRANGSRPSVTFSCY